jgi:hypothetical protein
MIWRLERVEMMLGWLLLWEVDDAQLQLWWAGW